MSKTHFVSVVLLVAGATSLPAQPQMIDGPGVTVNLNGSQLMHRTQVSYPADALGKGVEGTVVVQVRLDANGEVIDDAVLSGPDELRKGVQQAVLAWHFDKSAGGTTRVVNIDFKKPVGATLGGISSTPLALQRMSTPGSGGGRGGVGGPVFTANAQQLSDQQAVLGFLQDMLAKAQQDRARNPGPNQDAIVLDLQQKLQIAMANQQVMQRQAGNRKFGTVVVAGLSDSAREQLIAQMPFHPGDPWSAEIAAKAIDTARAFDSHASALFAPLSDDTMELRVSLPTVFGAQFTPASAGGGAVVAQSSGPIPPGAMRIGGNVQAANLVSATKPVYPPLAKLARQQGTVRFEATISREGAIQDLQVVSGPPLLIPAAQDAVKTWVYKPTMLNGAPVVVVTTIDVNFSLSETPPPAQ